MLRAADLAFENKRFSLFLISDALPETAAEMRAAHGGVGVGGGSDNTHDGDDASARALRELASRAPPASVSPVQHPLQRWFALSTLVLLCPLRAAHEYAAPLDADEAALLLSALNIGAAACACTLPLFVSIERTVREPGSAADDEGAFVISFSSVPNTKAVLVFHTHCLFYRGTVSFEAAWNSALPRYIGRIGARALACDLDVVSTTAQVRCNSKFLLVFAPECDAHACFLMPCMHVIFRIAGTPGRARADKSGRAA